MKVSIEMSKEEVRILKELERATGFDTSFIVSQLLFEVYSSYKSAKKSKRIDDVPSCILSEKLLKDIKKK